MPRDSRHDKEDEEDEERQGLLSEPASAPSPDSPPAPASPSPAASPPLDKQGSTTIVAPALEKQLSTGGGKQQQAEGILCRICLEEDTPGNLDSPCGCAGTQRFAHQACIQRWVEEKGNTRCEICGQAYRGDYVAPPPVVRSEAAHPMVPIMIVDPTNPAVRLALQRGTNALAEDDDPYVRQPAVKFMLTAAMFVVFLIMLHNTAMMDASAADDGSDGSGGWPAQGPPPPDQGMPDDGDPESFSDGLVLFLFWILTKLLLIGIPLWAILKVAQRQAQRQQYEELLRAMDTSRQGRVVFRVQGSREQAAGGLNAV